MTKQEKQLLLIDLCARLPYGVKVQNKLNGEVIDLETRMYCLPAALATNFKPYLRPMSSMTEEEHNLLINLFDTIYNPKAEFFLIADFFNKRMLDYRNLIKQGLALEAHEGMYK